MLTANEHHAETRGTRDCCEARAAKLTLLGIAGTSGAAVRTVKCFCLHRCLFYQFGYRWWTGKVAYAMLRETVTQTVSLRGFGKHDLVCSSTQTNSLRYIARKSTVCVTLPRDQHRNEQRHRRSRRRI